MTKPLRILHLLPLVLALTWAPLVHAQSALDRENAQALYRAGNDARDAGDFTTAARRYEGAYALVQTPIIAVALGKADLARGRLIEARQTLLAVERIPEKLHESRLTTTARSEARALAAQIEPRIPSVTLKIKAPLDTPRPTVMLDGETIPELALEVPTKVNPGIHLAVITAHDTKTETSFTVAEGEAREVLLDSPTPPPPLPAPQPSLPSATTTAPPDLAPRPAANPRAMTQRVRHSRTTEALYGTLAFATASFAVSGAFGVLALNDRSSLNALCSKGKESCPPSAQSDINALHTHAIVSDVTLGTGLLGVSAAAVLLIVIHRGESHANDGSHGNDEKSALSLQPWVGLGAVGMNGRF